MEPIELAIALAYQAASDQALWPQVLEYICAAVNGWGAQILGISKHTGQLTFTHGARHESV